MKGEKKMSQILLEQGNIDQALEIDNSIPMVI